MTSRQSASSISSSGFQRWIAALATTMSILPWSRSTASATRAQGGDIADVGAHRLGAPAIGADLAHGLVEFLGRRRRRVGGGRDGPGDVERDDVGAVGGEFDRDRAADAARRAGDDRGLAGERRAAAGAHRAGGLVGTGLGDRLALEDIGVVAGARLSACGAGEGDAGRGGADEDVSSNGIHDEPPARFGTATEAGARGSARRAASPRLTRA